MLESFWQVLVTVSIFLREPYGGVLTRHILQSIEGNGKLSQGQVFFIVFTTVAYAFIAIAAVSFIAERQRQAMSLKEKVYLIIVYLIIKSKDIRSYFFLIILGGSLGNLFDRIYYSAVLDFIDISYKGYHWFIFNVADIFITVGILCLILVELFFNKHELNDEK